MTQCFLTLSCYSCGQGFMKAPCVHSFCSECFQSENNSSNDCNLCTNPPAESSPSKRSRMQEIHEYPKTSNEQNLNECSECKNKYITEVQRCQECLYSFCLDCINKHEETIKTMYSASETFAKERKSDKNREEMLLHVSDLRKENENKFVKIKNLICRLTAKKASFRNNVNEIHSELIRRRNHLLDYIKRMFKKQCEELCGKENQVIQEYDEEIRHLTEIQTDLKELVQSSRHFPMKPSNENISKFKQFSRRISKIEDKNYMFEFKKVRVNHETLNVQKARQHLIVGVELFINNDIFRNNNAYVTSVAYESNVASVTDMCYDDENKHLFVLERRRQCYKILKISGRDVLNESFEIVINDAFLPRIALLPNRCIILLLGKKLRLINQNLRDWGTVHPMLKDLDISAMCTSACVTQTYMLVYANKFSLIYKYDSYSDPISQRLAVPKEPCYMAVHADLDHIVLGGALLKKLALYSLVKSRFLHSFWKPLTNDCFGGFLSDSLFVVYTNKSWKFEVIDFEKKRTIRYIENVHNGGKKRFGYVNSIKPFNSNGIFVCHWNDRTSEIYKMIF